MTQKALPIRNQRYSRRVLSGAAGVVALDRHESGDITLRFLSQPVEWGEPVREVRLDLELAEKLQWLLSDELEKV